MVDRKTGVKPKKAPSRKSKAASKNPVELRPKKTETLADEAKLEAIDSGLEAKPITKAGKHSAKAIREAEAKQAKLQRKTTAAKEAPAKPAKKPPRSRLERAGKKFRAVAKNIDSTKTYSLTEALELTTKTSPVKFDATVELHINLGVDPKQADQNIRGTVVLPSGSGKTVRIAVFADGVEATKAKAAGATISGVDTLSKLFDKQSLDFDILIAPPTQMAALAKYARVLGPKGLMPNPKSGTVAADVEAAVKEAKAGRVEYRIDSAGIIHLAMGKVSFGASKLQANAEAILGSVRAARPGSLKGDYIKSIFVTTSMGPSIKLTL